MVNSPRKGESLKISLLGCDSVGKTSLMIRVANGTFTLKTSVTIGFDARSKIFRVADANGTARDVVVNLYDTKGEEHLSPMVLAVCRRGQDAVVIVYDVNTPSTFEAACNLFGEASVFEGNPVFALIGNMVDKSKGSPTAVPADTAERFARENHMLFALCSAKTGEGVDEAFTTVVQHAYMYEKYDKVTISAPTNTDKKNRCEIQ